MEKKSTIKIQKQMRNLFFLILVLTSSCWAHSGFAQMTNVKLNVHDGTIESIFREISQQCKVEFFYDTSIIDVKKPIKLAVKTGTFAQIMKAILGDKYEYTLKDKYVLITRKTAANQGNIVIKGVVKNIEGDPMPGVSVAMKGTRIGASTDRGGQFSFSIKRSDNIVLLFSFIGMTKKEVICKGTENEEFTVTLEDDATGLEEVVVTGYQEIAKGKMTGAVETITAKDIANKGYNFIGDIIKGQLAGVNVRSISGEPGSRPEIRIRGINSISGSRDPMWIVDGMPMVGSLNDINPDDIESITVLKDAAATAVYGSRAANGVIVVKTKSGKTGKAEISIRSSYSFDEAPKMQYDMMTTAEKINFERVLYEDFPNADVGGRVFQLLKRADSGHMTREQAEKEIAKLSNINTDWLDILFRTAQTHSHSVSLSGGDEKTKYYGSANFRSLQGIEPQNQYRNGGISIKLSHEFNKWLKLDMNVGSNFRNTTKSTSSVSITDYAVNANPYERLYEDDGSYAYDRSYDSERSTLQDGYRFNMNILEDYDKNTRVTKYASTDADLGFEVKLLDGLRYSARGSLSYTFSNSRQVYGPGSYSSEKNLWVSRIYGSEIPDEMNLGSLRENLSRETGWTIRNQLEYGRTFNDDHSLSLFAGHEISRSLTNGFGTYAPEYDPIRGLTGIPKLDGVDASKLKIGDLNSTSESEGRSVSMFATASYSYDSRYTMSASFRLDGVNVIDPKNRFTPLWNVSGRWNIHKESFMKSVTFISSLALRASYGYTGNIDRSALPFTMMSYTSSSLRYNGLVIPQSISPSNPSVKWEKKEDRSFGLEMGLFKSRLNLTVNYYNNIIRDLLDNKRLAISTGQRLIRANVSSIQNYGWEFSARAVLIATKNVNWSITMNTSINRNKILETYYTSIEEAGFPSTLRNPIAGYSTDAWFGYQFAGVDPQSGNAMAYVDKTDSNGTPLGHLLPNGRRAINMETENKDLATGFLGDGYPPISGGFNTSFNYKRFTISANFSFMARHMILNSRKGSRGGTLGSAQSNLQVAAMNRWRKPGDITDTPRYSEKSSSWSSDIYDFRLEEGSYVKCNDISLGYSFSRKICEKISVRNLRLNINLRDVFTLSTYKSGDPENFGAYGYPNARKYMISLSLGF